MCPKVDIRGLELTFNRLFYNSATHHTEHEYSLYSSPCPRKIYQPYSGHHKESVEYDNQSTTKHKISSTQFGNKAITATTIIQSLNPKTSNFCYTNSFYPFRSTRDTSLFKNQPPGEKETQLWRKGGRGEFGGRRNGRKLTELVR